jgi:acetone carboxylase alpha subunit
MSATETTAQSGAPAPRTPETEAFLNDLLTNQPVMFAPDPEIMQEHRIRPRSEREEAALAAITDATELTITQSRVEAILESAKDMLQQISAAPAAKWGDLTVGVYSRDGDLSLCTSSGVNIFSAAASPVPKFINRYWANEPTVGVREGDVFYHNDSHFGGAHNPDHTLLLPLLVEGEHIAWVGAVIHEGENGAIDPGGFAPRATDPYGEGLRIPPMKIGEAYILRRDVINTFQNHVRDPLLWLVDIRAKLAGARDVERRLQEFMRERSPELLIATLRSVLESTEAEVHRRVALWPDGIYRAVHFGDCTLLEERLYKIAVEFEKRGDRLVMRTHGTAPAIDRAMNAQAHSTKSLVGNEFMNFLFADLPRNAGFVSALDFELEPGTMLTATREHATSLSMLSGFYLNTTVHTALTKALFSNPGVTEVIAPWYAMLPTLQYGGLTQHLQVTANISVELNAMGGGAHRDRDGEHAAAPFFATLADWGETEDRETEIPVLGLWRHIPADNHGFGKHRGGSSVEWAYALWGSQIFAFMVTSTGARFPVTGGLFGGYGGACTPLTVIKPERGIEGLRDWLANGAPGLTYDAAALIVDRPLPGEYEVTNPSRPAAPIPEGEIWIQRIGGGGGYGDPLERDPQAVMTDLRRGLISPEVARDVYRLVWDEERQELDAPATEHARSDERAARIARGKPYDEFVASWRRDQPPEAVPFLGSWEWSSEADG